MGGNMWIANPHKKWDEDEENESVVEFKYSGLQFMKGTVLRAAVAYLKSLKDAVPSSREFLLNAGIKSVAECSNDEEAIARGNEIINKALAIMNEWIRVPSRGEGVGIESLFMGSRFRVGMDPPNLDVILNTNFHSTKVFSVTVCPLSFEKVDLRGLYHIMKLPDNNILIYSDEAQLMASTLEKVIPFIKEDAEGGMSELATEVKNAMAGCVGDNVVIDGGIDMDA